MAETLSRRKDEVARLYSRGFSAKYIARRLFISPRTVEVHIRRAYQKLGVSSRDELIELTDSETSSQHAAN